MGFDNISILIGSSNPKGLVDFYTQVFGQPGWSSGDFTGWQVGSSFVTVGPHADIKGASKEPARILINFQTPELKVEFDRIKALGATVVQEPYTPGEDENMTIATFSDPDGNYFQLMTPFEM